MNTVTNAQETPTTTDRPAAPCPTDRADLIRACDAILDAQPMIADDSSPDDLAAVVSFEFLEMVTHTVQAMREHLRSYDAPPPAEEKAGSQ
jgi:hypothetical protein